MRDSCGLSIVVQFILRNHLHLVRGNYNAVYIWIFCFLLTTHWIIVVYERIHLSSGLLPGVLGIYFHVHNVSVQKFHYLCAFRASYPSQEVKFSTNKEKWSGYWEVTVDLLGCQALFSISITNKPDIVIWYESKKVVNLV